jgi:hypothetical protein
MQPYRSRLLSTTYLSLAVGVGALALGAALPASVAGLQAGMAYAACNPCNPCAAKTPAATHCNPCAAANPCNPCAAKLVPAAGPCNPCAAQNPCAAANPCRPFNPCQPQ